MTCCQYGSGMMSRAYDLWWVQRWTKSESRLLTACFAVYRMRVLQPLPPDMSCFQQDRLVPNDLEAVCKLF